jgi:hypothetical protein
VALVESKLLAEGCGEIHDGTFRVTVRDDWVTTVEGFVHHRDAIRERFQTISAFQQITRWDFQSSKPVCQERVSFRRYAHPRDRVLLVGVEAGRHQQEVGVEPVERRDDRFFDDV